VRLFLALNLPADVRERVHRATAALREAAPEIAWVSEERLHLTIKFLGAQPDEATAALAESMREVAAAHRPVELELGGIGAFPNRRRPRIVWLGIAADHRLELLHHDVELACERLGYPLEGRAFRPHITLGRTKQRSPDARALGTAARTVTFRETTVVDTLDLMESRLQAAGPRYAVVAAAPLRPR
jgi:2'-5' RNA ligase